MYEFSEFRTCGKLVTFLCYAQVISGILSLSLNLLSDCRLHLPDFLDSANFINHLHVTISFIVVVVNVIISAFDPNFVISPLEWNTKGTKCFKTLSQQFIIAQSQLLWKKGSWYRFEKWMLQFELFVHMYVCLNLIW